MTAKEIILPTLNGSTALMMQSLGDFSDAEFFIRPCPGANHVTWQMGHLLGYEWQLLQSLNPSAAPKLPAGFADKFTRNTATIDDPKFFGMAKSELLQLFEQTRKGLSAWLEKASDDDLKKDSGQSWAPTIGLLFAMAPMHGSMHLGQIQVLRRKLGKPILF